MIYQNNHGGVTVYLISESTVLHVNNIHRVSTVTSTVEIFQGPAWTLIRGPRWRVEKKKSTWLVLYISLSNLKRKYDSDVQCVHITVGYIVHSCVW